MKKISALILLLALQLLIVTTVRAQPAQVIIIRHGEKPLDRAAINLTTKGQERAMALAPFLTETTELIGNGLPVALFATKITREDPSRRTQETITPLSEKLHLPIQADYINKDYHQLAHHILANPIYRGRMVLICWDHRYIPQLSAAFGVKPQPPPWPETVFDRVFIITFPNGQATLVNLPQRLLFGDSPQ